MCVCGFGFGLVWGFCVRGFGCCLGLFLFGGVVVCLFVFLILPRYLKQIIRLLTQTHRCQRSSEGSLQTTHVAAPERFVEPLIPQ